MTSAAESITESLRRTRQLMAQVSTFFMATTTYIVYGLVLYFDELMFSL